MIFRESGYEVQALAEHYTEIAESRWQSSPVDPERLIEISFEDLIYRPLHCATLIYEKAKLKFDDAVRSRMQIWLQMQGKQTKHRFEEV